MSYQLNDALVQCHPSLDSVQCHISLDSVLRRCIVIIISLDIVLRRCIAILA